MRPGETYKFRGKTVTILDRFDSNTFWVTDGKSFTISKRDLIQSAKPGKKPKS